MENLSKQKKRYYLLFFFCWVFLTLVLAITILIPSYILAIYLISQSIPINFVFVVVISALALSYTLIKPVSIALTEDLHEKMYYEYVLQTTRVEVSEVNNQIAELLQEDDIKVIDVITSGSEHCIIKYKIPFNKIVINNQDT